MEQYVEKKECILCGKQVDYKQPTIQEEKDWRHVECLICGHFKVTRQFTSCFPWGKGLNELSEESRHVLSCLSRNQWELYEEELDIDLDSYKSLIAEGIPGLIIPETPKEKSLMLLSYIQKKSPGDFSEVLINVNSYYPICFAKNSRDFIKYIDYLEEQGLIRDERQTAAAGNRHFYLTMDGWAYLQETNMASIDCFVAMNFDEKYKPLFDDSIKDAVLNSGYNPVLIRIENEESPDTSITIDSRIITSIEKAKFVIADFSGQKPNVYYEAGFAKGLRLPVIYCCENRKEEIDALGFDIRNYFHLLWSFEKLNEFSKKLENIIKIQIGEGSFKKGISTENAK